MFSWPLGEGRQTASTQLAQIPKGLTYVTRWSMFRCHGLWAGGLGGGKVLYRMPFSFMLSFLDIDDISQFGFCQTEETDLQDVLIS